MRRLNYNQLYYFYIIASLGSIKDACEKLHLTQPTISGQLKALEEDLGYKLFDRKYRKLILNDMGKLVFQKIEKVFLASEELAEAPPTKSPAAKILRLGILKTVPHAFAHAFYREIAREEGSKALIRTGHLEEFIDQMKKDQLDIILSDAPYTCLKSKFKSVNLGANSLCAAGPPAFKNLRNGFPASLSGAPFLHYTKDNPLREELEMFFNFNNINPDVKGRVDDINLLVQMIKEGDFVSIVPTESAADEFAKGELINLGQIDSIRLSRWAIISGHSQKKPRVTELLNNFLSKRQEKRREKRPVG